MPPALLEIAARQWSVFSASQAARHGVAVADLRALCRTGVVREPHRGVFVLCGTPDTPEQRLWIAYLAVGWPCAFSGLTAGWLLRLPGCAAPRRPALVVLAIRRPRTAAADVRRIAWWGDAVVERDGQLPRLGMRDTIVTMAPLLRVPALLAVVQHAVFHQHLIADDLRERLRTGLPGGVRLGAALDRFELGHDSQPEVDVRRRLGRAGLPPDHCNVALRSPDGTLVGPYDGYYEAGVAYEYDGRAAHDTITAEVRDGAKSTKSGLIGVDLVRLDRRDRADPRRLVRRVSTALARVDGVPAVTVVHAGNRPCLCGWAPGNPR